MLTLVERERRGEGAMASRRVPLLHSVSVFQPPLTRYSRCSPGKTLITSCNITFHGPPSETFRSSSSTPGSRSISLTGKVQLGEFLSFPIDLFSCFDRREARETRLGGKGEVSVSTVREKTARRKRRRNSWECRPCRASASSSTPSSVLQPRFVLELRNIRRDKR